MDRDNFSEKKWFLQVESKELEDFRSFYHLFPKIHGFDFTIALGSKQVYKQRKSFPLMKVGISNYAA